MSNGKNCEGFTLKFNETEVNTTIEDSPKSENETTIATTSTD